MSGDINQVILQGHMTANPVFTLGKNQDGTLNDKRDRCYFVLGINPPTKHPNAKPSFPFMMCWGNQARIAAQYGEKGKGWGAVCSVKTERTELADGKFKNHVEFVVQRHIMGEDSLESKKKKAADKAAAAAAAPAPQPEAAPEVDYDKAAKALADADVSPEDVQAFLKERQDQQQEKSGDAPF